MSRILFVDDHAFFRAALRELLSQEPDIQIVGEAGNLCDALRFVGTLSPHLVVTDLAMPDTHGIEAVTKIKHRYPDVKILVISFHGENEYKSRCRRAGAAGYIVKDAVHDELCDGIRKVLGGKTCLGMDAPDDFVSDHLVDSAVSNEDGGRFVH